MTDALVFAGEPQFGAAPALRVADRPAAFGVCAHEGLLALVHIHRPDGVYHDLPGGGVDPNEDAAMALVREFGEETGMRVRAGRVLARAAQFMTKTDGEVVNNRAVLFEAHWIEDAPELKREADHTLVWASPVDALRLLRLENHVWAVAAWLRRG